MSKKITIVKLCALMLLIGAGIASVKAIPIGNDVEFIPVTRNLGVGIINPAAKLHVNGSSLITGNVGIGTTSPVNKLHVYKPNGAAIYIDTGNGNTVDQSTLNLVTKGDGATSFSNPATRGWHLTARGNTYTTASQQNDLLFTFWNGTTYSQRMFFEHDTGNVGIGTTTPAAKLDVNGEIRATNIVLPSGGTITGGSLSGVRVSSLVSPDGSPDPALRLDNNGNVGIGHDPSDYIGKRLAVRDGGMAVVSEGNISSDLVLRTHVPNSTPLTTVSQLMFETSNGTRLAPNAVKLNRALGCIGSKGHDGTSFSTGACRITFNAAQDFTSTNHGQHILFNTIATTSGAVNTERMRITADGNVGIGTVSPAAKLEVRDGQFSLVNNGSLATSKITAYASTANNNFAHLMFQTANGSITNPTAVPANRILACVQARGYDGTGFNPAGCAMRIVAAENFTPTTRGTTLDFATVSRGTTASVSRIRINENGNVGIGTTTPTATLDVNGTIRANNLQANTLTRSNGERILAVNSLNNVVLRNGLTAQVAIWINGDTSTVEDLRFQNNGSTRWILRNNSEAETGNNNGSNFQIISRHDSASIFQTPFTITRRTGNIGVGVTAPSEKLDVSGVVKARAGLYAINALTINGATGVKDFTFQTNGNRRWLQRVSGDETGSNNGSNFSMFGFADDGSTNTTGGVPIFAINRRNAYVTINGGLVPEGDTTTKLLVSGEVKTTGIKISTSLGLINGGSLIHSRKIAVEPSGTIVIDPLVGVNPTNSLMRIHGGGVTVDITANPQIADGTDGQILVLRGRSVNGVKFDTGDGLKLNGGGSFVLGDGDTLTLMYDAFSDLWFEISRSDNT